MKLEINVWDHTGPGHGKVGYATSVLLPEANVGHINVLLTIDETEADLNLLHGSHSKLNPKPTVISTPKKVDKEFFDEMNKLSDTLDNIANPQATENLTSSPDNYALSEYSAEEINALEFVNSFWPSETPSVSKLFRGIFSRNVGVKPSFETLKHDRKRESDEVMSNGQLSTPKIVHPYGRILERDIVKLQKEEQSILEKNAKLQKARTNIFLDPDVKKLEDEKDELSVELKKLKEQLKVCQESIDKNELSVEFYNLTHQLADANKDIGRLVTNEKESVSQTPSVESFSSVYNDARQLNLNKMHNLRDVLQNKIETTEKKLDEVNQQLETKKAPIDVINQQIQVHNKELTEVTVAIRNLKTKLEDVGESIGKNPDHTIMIETKDDEGFFDKNAILNEMEKQRLETNEIDKANKSKSKWYKFNKNDEETNKYNLIKNNCASTAKRCILAGITDNFKKALKANEGISEDFFKVNSVETPGAVKEWYSQLNEYIAQYRSKGIQLNNIQNEMPSPPQPK